MNNPNYIPRISFLTMIFVFNCVCFAAADDIPDVKSVIKQVHDAEQRLKNVYVEASAKIFDPVPDQPDGWVPTKAMCRVRAWIDGASDGSFKLDVLKEVIRWTDGPKGREFSTQPERTIHYNAKKVVSDDKASGPIDSIDDLHQTTITEEDQRQRGIPFLYGAGAYLTPNFMYRPLSGYLNEQLKLQPKTEGMSIVTGKDRVNETEVISLTIKQNTKALISSETWYFDPSRGWAILKHVRTKGSINHVVELIEVSKLKEISENCWYPTDAVVSFSIILDVNPLKLHRIRYLYHADKVTGNDPDFAKSLTEVDIPSGAK